MFVRNHLTSTMIAGHSIGNSIESLVVTVKELDLIVVTIYKSPSSTTEEMTTSLSLIKNDIDSTMEANPKLTKILTSPVTLITPKLHGPQVSSPTKPQSMPHLPPSWPS